MFRTSLRGSLVVRTVNLELTNGRQYLPGYDFAMIYQLLAATFFSSSLRNLYI